MELTNEQLFNVTGGADKIGVIAGIMAAVSFVFGIIDGYVRPASCNLKTKVKRWK